MKRFLYRDLDGQIFLLVDSSFKRAKKAIEKTFRVSQLDIIIYDTTKRQWVVEDVWIPRLASPSEKAVLVVDGSGEVFWALMTTKDQIMMKILSTETGVSFFRLDPGKALLIEITRIKPSFPFHFKKLD